MPTWTGCVTCPYPWKSWIKLHKVQKYNPDRIKNRCSKDKHGLCRAQPLLCSELLVAKRMKPLKFKTHLGTKIINCQLTLRVFLSTFLGAVLVSTSGSWSDTHWEPLLYYEFLHNISKVRLWTHCINNLWSGLRQRSSSRTICSAETCKTILWVHQKNKTQTLSCMLFWGFFWRVMLFHRVQRRFLGSAKAPEKCWGYICCCWRGVVLPQRTLRKWCWSQQRKFFHEDEGMEKSIFSFLKKGGK